MYETPVTSHIDLIRVVSSKFQLRRAFAVNVKKNPRFDSIACFRRPKAVHQGTGMLRHWSSDRQAARAADICVNAFLRSEE
ncbi:uncharacterized protein LOC144616142 isoform X3 [Panthera onca]